LSSGDNPLADCTVPEAKIADYLLNPAHPVGSPKAKFFTSFGFSRTDSPGMAAALAEHPLRNAIEETTATRHGAKHLVRCSFATPDGRNPCIVTVWMKEGDAPARFVTAYPA
jgi:filamentous hemagglutinin